MALKLDPGDASVYALLGDARFAAGEYDDAVEQYLKALALNPNLEDVAEKLSLAYAGDQSGGMRETGAAVTESGTPVPTELPTVALINDTATLTAEVTSTGSSPTPTAGIVSGVTGVVALMFILIVTGSRRK